MAFFTLNLDPSTLVDAPAALRHAAENFSSFNPALLPPISSGDEQYAMRLFFRVSNMHFCPGSGRVSWRDSVVLQTHVRNYIATAVLDSRDWTLLHATQPAVLGLSTQLFRAKGDDCEQRIDAGGGVFGTFSGPEDPRPFWSPETPHAPWLLTSAWSADCRRLRMHLVKLPPAPLSPSTLVPSAAPLQLPLVVERWPKAGSSSLPHPEAEPIQKNWLPFVHDGALYVEYSIEPHVVLRVDAGSGRCEPISNAVIGGGGIFPSFPPLARLAAEYGRVSGGAAPLRLPDRRVYLGLAHVKESRRTPEHLGTAHMVYRHAFYAFADRHPFELVAAGAPFTLPEAPITDPSGGGSGSTVQFAAGMVLSASGAEIVVSYSTLDCGARLAQMPLDGVLRDLGLLW